MYYISSKGNNFKLNSSRNYLANHTYNVQITSLVIDDFGSGHMDTHICTHAYTNILMSAVETYQYDFLPIF